jgi:hypothetical protein
MGRLEAKARREPSGLHRGEEAPKEGAVRGLAGAEPSVGTIQRSPWLRFSSFSVRDRTKTTHSPPGERVGLLTLSIRK